LEDQKTLIDYDVQQDSTIFMSIRPPPNDIFRFDECCACHAQVVEPAALPCGHSCCRSCIIPEATVCQKSLPLVKKPPFLVGCQNT
jgi:hypothetical protein